MSGDAREGVGLVLCVGYRVVRAHRLADGRLCIHEVEAIAIDGLPDDPGGVHLNPYALPAACLAVVHADGTLAFGGAPSAAPRSPDA